MSVATPRRSYSLDSLIIDDEGVTTESNLTTSTIRSAQKCWLSAFSQAASDLRSSRLNWKLWIIMVLLTIGFKFTLSLLLINGTFNNNLGTGAACDISGLFSPFGDQPSQFAFSRFFQINLGLGNLTFTQAKVIDTFWDLVVGRGGQMCLALVSWRLFADCATISLATQPLSFAAFHTIFLESEPSIVSLWSIAKSFITQKRLASKLTSAFIVFVMSFILAWPTLTSAATGYVPITQPVVSDQSSQVNPNLISFWNFRPIAYIIHDFWRINTLNTSSILRTEGIYEICLPDYHQIPGSPSELLCSLLWSVSNYTSEYGFYGLSNRSSQFMGVQLEPPTLNIEACSVLPSPERPALYGWNWIDPKSENGNSQPFKDISRNAWEYSNKTYWLADIIALGSCAPEINIYRWGASFLQLFIIIILLAIWALGIFVLWLFYHLRLQAIGKPEVPRGYQALEILTRNVNEQLQYSGFKLSTMTDDEAKQWIKKKLKGGSISFEGLIKVEGFRIWLRKEWLSAFISFGLFPASLGLYFSNHFLLSFSPFSFVFPALIGTCFTIDVSKTWGSRVVVFIISVGFGSLIGLATYLIVGKL